MDPVRVDDHDPSILYSPGDWKAVKGSPGPNDTSEYLFTKTGTTVTGATAKFNFSGTSVEVYGSQGSFDFSGRPFTVYSIDDMYFDSYRTPVIQPPYFTVQTLFYRSPILAAGEHQLVITNMNGSVPNNYFLDFIQYYTSNSSTTSSLSAATSSLVQASPPESASARVAPTGSPPDTAAAKKHATGTIIASVISVLVVSGVLLGLLYFVCRRKARSTARKTVDPFEPWRGGEESTPRSSSVPSLAQTTTVTPFAQTATVTPFASKTSVESDSLGNADRLSLSSSYPGSSTASRYHQEPNLAQQDAVTPRTLLRKVREAHNPSREALRPLPSQSSRGRDVPGLHSAPGSDAPPAYSAS